MDNYSAYPQPQPGEVWRIGGFKGARSSQLNDALVLVSAFNPTYGYVSVHLLNATWEGQSSLSAHASHFIERVAEKMDPGIAALYGIDSGHVSQED